MQEFLSSESGMYLAIICILIGVSDLIIGRWWLSRRSSVKNLQKHAALQKIVPILIVFDVGLIAFGWVVLKQHL